MPPASDPEWLGPVPSALPTPLAVTRSSDGVVAYANAALLRLLGAASEQVVGRRIDDLLAGRDDLLVEPHTAAFLTPDGEEAAVTELHDISQQRQTERELAELARFPDMNPGPVLRLDRDGVVLLANAAARRLGGGGALIGSGWLARCEGLDQEAWRRVVDQGVSLQHETTLGGAWFMFTYVPSPTEGMVFAFGADITARKQAEEQLGEQARELAELARFPDMNPGPVLRLDLEGSVLLANHAARDVFGEIVGSSWLDVMPASAGPWGQIIQSPEVVRLEERVGDRDFVFAHRVDAASSLVFVYGTDVSMQKKAEQALRQSERMATLGTLAAGVAHELNNPAAATRRAAAHLRDALARLEEAHLRLDAAGLDESGLELVRQLDVRARHHAPQASSLDTVTRGDRESALEEWLDEHGIADPWDLAPALVEQDLDPSELAELVGALRPQALGATLEWAAAAFPVYRLAHEIGQGSARISEIVSALKGYSYLGQPALQSVDLHKSLDDTLVILRHKLKAGIDVRRQYSADLPAVPAYGSELNQVWTNLLDNAADAMDGRGAITIRTRADQRWVVVEIEDDGPGIPDELVSRIFDPFFTTKDPGKGTGLGLSMTYAIVTEKHEGEITVSSRPGSTRFTVRLPLQTAAPVET